MARGSAEALPILRRPAAALLLAASACASAEPELGGDLEPRSSVADLDPGSPWPRDPGRHLNFGYTDPALAAVVGSALSRWARATCLPLSITSHPDHGIVMDDDRLIPDGREGQTTGASWDGTTVVLREGLSTELAAVLLAHEVCHILARTNDHTATGVCKSRVSRQSSIDEASLQEVCAVRDCGCFQPEEPAPLTGQP